MKIRDRVVMVTGGAGFVDSHLVDRLILEKPSRIVVVDNLFLGKMSNLDDAFQSGCPVEFVQVDASNQGALHSVAVKFNVEIVFNLAVIPLPTSLSYPEWTSRVNYESVLALCELARLGVISDLIHFSSSEAYGSAKSIPMTESHPLLPSTPYAAAKAAGDLLVQSYVETFGISAVIVRPFNNYGPRQNNGSYAGIFPVLIQNIVSGHPIRIFGDGLQTRDFVYVWSTVDLAVKVSKMQESRGHTYNLATGIETSILEIVEAVKSVFARQDHPVVHLDPRAGDVLRHCGDSEKLFGLLGERPPALNERFVSETIEWYLR